MVEQVPQQEKKKEGEGIQLGLLDILFPLFLPVKGMVWLGENLKATAEEEITDESRIQEKLLELQMKFEMDEISEEEYDRKETELMEKLEAIREYKEGE
ncbi:MAG: gas vesicle protein GvpG [bacterium]|nr:gas vesicle protein GvpG [bacterium]